MIEHTKPVVLVVEDDLPLLEAIQTKLSKEGFEILSSRSVDRAFGMPIEDGDSRKVTVDTIQKAIEHLAKLERVDLIWLDHNLIGTENGIDFVKKFRQNGGRLAKIPILVVSNTSDIELRKAYAEIGVPDYFVKAEHRLQDIIERVRDIVVAKDGEGC